MVYASILRQCNAGKNRWEQDFLKVIVALLLNSNIVPRNAKLSRAVCQWKEDDEATSAWYLI
jgi:hypothetical protein